MKSQDVNEAWSISKTIYLKAWVLPLISRDIHSGLYVVMFPKSFNTIWLDLFPKIFASKGIKQGCPSTFNFFLQLSFLAVVLPISAESCLLLVLAAVEAAVLVPPFPSPTLPQALGSYPLLTASPHSYQRKFGIVRAGSEDGPLPREGRTQPFK